MEKTKEQIEALVKAAEMGLGGSRFQVYEEIFYKGTASTGTNTKTFSRVEPGWLRVITHMAGVNDTSSPTFINLCHYSGSQKAIDKAGPAPLIGETVNWDGFIIIGEGDYTEIQFEGCTSGDDLYAVVSGFQIYRRD